MKLSLETELSWISVASNGFVFVELVLVFFAFAYAGGSGKHFSLGPFFFPRGRGSREELYRAVEALCKSGCSQSLAGGEKAGSGVFVGVLFEAFL